MFSIFSKKPKKEVFEVVPEYKMADSKIREYDRFAHKMATERREMERLGYQFYGRNQQNRTWSAN